jgi:hypothetical protein
MKEKSTLDPRHVIENPDSWSQGYGYNPFPKVFFASCYTQRKFSPTYQYARCLLYFRAFRGIQVIDLGLKKHIEIIQGLDSGYDFAKNSTSSLYDRTVPHPTVL